MRSTTAPSILDLTGYGGILELLAQVRHAPCFDADPEIFFADAPAELEVAKAICQECPVKDMCLAGALDRQEPYGVWGGQLVMHGSVAHKRPRGRPRKVAAATCRNATPDTDRIELPSPGIGDHEPGSAMRSTDIDPAARGAAA